MMSAGFKERLPLVRRGRARGVRSTRVGAPSMGQWRYFFAKTVSSYCEKKKLQIKSLAVNSDARAMTASPATVVDIERGCLFSRNSLEANTLLKSR